MKGTNHPTTAQEATMSKSTDETVTKDLIETLEDGREGFAKGAEKLRDIGHGAAGTFDEYSRQRGGFADDLRQLAREYGDEIDESGSLAGALHRGWMAIKDAVTGSDPDGVFGAAEQGEDHAVSEFDKALDADISDRLRTMVQLQSTAVRAAHDRVKALRDGS